ncbi:hypothetical protein OsJ_22629 [Oryza sativa Japonica Group]|uniref:Pectinesterase inhibitor domain-containing protein n=1 Tax=Oryza sativa subsp. japonica TaxID=39947 RepID=A3BFB3_ORYSJ|nr:hypothetical protein OsJ_22629 [Oryza sativa Japonica Group]
MALLLAAFAAAATANSGAAPAASDFIRKSCRATQYPAAPFGFEVLLGTYGALAAAAAAPAARAPCATAWRTWADSVGHLRDAAQELGGNMGRAGSPGFKWHLSNVQTWCSAALTDENTCLDGLSRGVDAATRSAIRGKIVEVAQVTSNALALVNRVAPAN